MGEGRVRIRRGVGAGECLGVGRAKAAEGGDLGRKRVSGGAQAKKLGRACHAERVGRVDGSLD